MNVVDPAGDGVVVLETGADGVDVLLVTTREQLGAAWEVRFEVFVDEQRVPAEEEVDDLDTDPTTTHVLAVQRATGRALGTGRLLSDPAHPGEVHLGRLAVRKAARGTGLGARLVVAIEALAVAMHGVPDDGSDDVPGEVTRGHDTGASDISGEAGSTPLSVRVVLSAQEAAMGFYGRLGYEVVNGERYLDAGIWHQDMARTVRS